MNDAVIIDKGGVRTRNIKELVSEFVMDTYLVIRVWWHLSVVQKQNLGTLFGYLDISPYLYE